MSPTTLTPTPDRLSQRRRLLSEALISADNSYDPISTPNNVEAIVNALDDYVEEYVSQRLEKLGLLPKVLRESTPEIERQVRALIEAGKEIEAVKLARQLRGIGLREAVIYMRGLKATTPVGGKPCF